MGQTVDKLRLSTTFCLRPAKAEFETRPRADIRLTDAEMPRRSRSPSPDLSHKRRKPYSANPSRDYPSPTRHQHHQPRSDFDDRRRDKRDYDRDGRDYDRRRRSRSRDRRDRDRDRDRSPPPRSGSLKGDTANADPELDEKMRAKRERLEAWKRDRDAKKALSEAKAKALALAAGKGAPAGEPSLFYFEPLIPNHLILPSISGHNSNKSPSECKTSCEAHRSTQPRQFNHTWA
jgi:hypothetical protein